MEFSAEEREFNDRLFKELCEMMPQEFEELVMMEDISRMPTAAEMKKLQTLIRSGIDDGTYADYTGYKLKLLRSFTDITTTIEP